MSEQTERYQYDVGKPLRLVPEGYCQKHGKALDVPCVHCAEDAKIWTERIEAVAEAIAPDTPSSLGLHIINDRSPQRAMIIDALRSLVREIRR